MTSVLGSPKQRSESPFAPKSNYVLRFEYDLSHLIITTQKSTTYIWEIASVINIMGNFCHMIIS